MKLISLGCGTGNYEIELAKHVENVEGVDISPGMISRAKTKLTNIPNLNFRVGDARDLSDVVSESFDTALFPLSLQHMGSYDNQKMALAESYRVLKRGGLIVIQTLSESQLRGGFWFFDLIPKATQRLIDKYIPLPHLIDSLENMGFKYQDSIVPIDATLQGKSHFDTGGPFKPEWRSGNSVWSLATKKEIENALGRLERMKKDGTFEEFYQRMEALRRNLGQMTFVYAIKQ